MLRLSFFQVLALLSLGILFTSVLSVESQDNKRPAILMVHGLSGDYSKWNELIAALPSGRFATGGSFNVGTDKSLNDPLETLYLPDRRIIKNYLPPRDDQYLIFTLSFVNNTGLSFIEQGQGLRRVVDRIAAEHHREEVILVAHSMGGLSSRACIMQKDDNIVGLLTAATPHVGSYCGLVSQYYNDHVLDFTPEQEKRYSEFGRDAFRAGMLGPIFTSEEDYKKLASFWDSQQFKDGSSQLGRILANYNPAHTALAGTVHAGTRSFKGLGLNDPAVKDLIPFSPQMLELYEQEFPQDLPVSVVLSTWKIAEQTPELEVAKDDAKPAYMNVSGQEILQTLKNVAAKTGQTLRGSVNAVADRTMNLPVEGMAFIEQYLKAEYLKKEEDIYPAKGDYYKYHDGIVTTYSQDILNGISNPQDITNIAYFGTDRFHIWVPNDVDIMIQALEYLLNPGSRGVKVGLILDSSGSMSSNDPDDIRIKAAGSVLQILQEGDGVFLVDFDDGARFLNQGYTGVYSGASFSPYLRQIDANGGTNIGGGLDKMKEALISSGIHDFSSTGVLLLTDGQGDYTNEIDWYVQNEIPVFTVSYKEYADASLMDKLASLTGGAYIRANNESDVFRAFKEFYNGLAGYSTVYRETYTSEGFYTQPIYIDESAKEMIVYLNGLVPNYASIRFTDPSRTEHSLTEFGPVIQGDNYIYAKIPVSSPGFYTFMLDQSLPVQSAGPGPSHPSLSPELRSYTFELSTNTSMKVDMQLEENSKGYYAIDFFEKDADVKETKGEAEVNIIAPSGKEMTMKSQKSNGELAFYPLEGKGNYNIDVKFVGQDTKGNKVQRHFFKSLLVGDFQPGYFGKITKVLGNSLTTGQGKLSGNRQGINVEVFKQGSDLSRPIARGYVTSVDQYDCVIELQFYRVKPEQGDIVLLNRLRWKGD